MSTTRPGRSCCYPWTIRNGLSDTCTKDRDGRDWYPTGGEVIRAIVARLTAGEIIKAHSDVHPSFHCAHRIHVPVTTNSRVWFTIDGRPYQFEVGQAYEINNQKQHSVTNKGAEDRITFIFDYIPPGH
jgi:hypothetical protein